MKWLGPEGRGPLNGHRLLSLERIWEERMDSVRVPECHSNQFLGAASMFLTCCHGIEKAIPGSGPSLQSLEPNNSLVSTRRSVLSVLLQSQEED